MEPKSDTLAVKMSVTERIKQMQQAQSVQVAIEKTERGVATGKEKLAKEEVERTKGEREQFVLQQTDKVLKESGILDGLSRINNELLSGNYERHDIVSNLSKGNVTLVWGKGFWVDFNKNIQGTDYFTIRVDVNAESEAISIGDSRLEKNDWIDKYKVDEILAKAYISAPWHHIEPSSDDWGDRTGTS